MQPIKILVNNMLTPDTLDGCMVYRNVIPFDALSAMGYEIAYLPIKKFDYHIGWFNRGYGKGIEKVVDLYREGGAKIIYECDDLLDAVTSDNPFRMGDYEPIAKSFRYLIRNADLITTTTHPLRDEIRKRTDKPVVVLPNSIRETIPRKRKGKRLRIGYGGGLSHYKDLDFLLDVILDLQKDFEFDFVTIGVGKNPDLKSYKENDSVYKHIESVFAKLDSVKNYQHVPPVPAWMYQLRLSEADLDIGVCPLQDNRFTRCKSAIKYYEYASVGTVTLAQDNIAYEDCNYTAGRFSEWKSKLKRLITDEPFREQLLEEQKEYVYKHRHIDNTRHLWDCAIKSVLSR